MVKMMGIGLKLLRCSVLITLRSSNETTSQPNTGPTIKSLIGTDVWMQTEQSSDVCFTTYQQCCYILTINDLHVICAHQK